MLSRFAMFMGLPLEVMAAALLFALPLQHRKHFAVRALLPFAAAALFGLLYRLAMSAGLWKAAQGTTAPLPFTLAYSAVSFCFGALLVLLTCRVSLAEVAYSTTAAYLTQHMSYCLHCFFWPDADLSSLTGYDFSYFLVRALTYCAVYFLVARPLAHHKHYDVNIPLSLAALVAALAIALFLSALVQQNIQPGNPLYRLCLLYDAFCCFFVLIGQRNQQKQLSLQHELDLQQQLWLRTKEQYERAIGSVDLINQKYHDLKHQVAAMNQLLAQAERGEKLPRLELPEPTYGARTDTGSQLLDTILTEKGLICDSRAITFTCTADGRCLDFFDAVDLYCLLGNALDNAIEGVSQLSDPEEKTIAVNIFSRSGLVIIQVENYYEGELEMAEGLPRTRKRNGRYHGFGLKSIQTTAEKYGGFVTVHTADHIFLLRVTVPWTDSPS